MSDGLKTKFGLWTALETLSQENNPRLVALIERGKPSSS